MRSLFLLLLTLPLLLADCDRSPTSPAPPPADPFALSQRSLLIQGRLAGTVAYLFADPSVVWWIWQPDHYEFGQNINGALSVWEKGTWWVQQISGQDYLVLDVQEGGQLVKTDNGPTWRYYSPGRHRIPFNLLGTSLRDPKLQLEMDVGRLYTYRLAPPDSLEAIKAHRF